MTDENVRVLPYTRWKNRKTGRVAFVESVLPEADGPTSVWWRYVDPTDKNPRTRVQCWDRGRFLDRFEKDASSSR